MGNEFWLKGANV